MYQLKTKQICLFFVAIIPITKFFMMNSLITEYAKNDMWISVLINIALDYLSFISIIFFYTREKTTFINFLKNKFGVKVKNIVLSFFVLYFIFKSIIPIFEQKEYVLSTLYITLPKYVYFIPFFLSCTYLCSQKLRALGRVSELLFALTIIGYLILVTLSVQNADFSSILPINYNNTSGIFNGAYCALNWFGDGLYLLFLMGEFEYKKGDYKKILLSYLISCLMVLIFSILFYSIFSSIAFRQRFAMTEVSKYSTVINNTGRFDYIGIMLILFVNIFSLTLPMFYACRLLQEIFQIKQNWLTSLVINTIILAFLIFTQQKFYYIEKLIINYFGFFYLLMGTAVPILLPILTISRRKNEICKN